MIETLHFDDEQEALVILDQTLLPNEIKYLSLTRTAAVFEAIQQLRVRGAPAIGIAAAYGIYLGMLHSATLEFSDFYRQFQAEKAFLVSARPTAVNLSWALTRIENMLLIRRKDPVPMLIRYMRLEADAILAEDIQTNLAIGEHALSLLKPHDGILTHCNAGSLATAQYGTATSPLYLGQQRGYNFRVFADETRPLLQGARLTTFELAQAGIDVTLICDNMAAAVMDKGWIQAVLVGCDRVAANGDTANKIGTAGVAILAHNYGIPFYVCAPTATIDLKTRGGGQIEIEERDPTEIYQKWYTKPMALTNGVKFYNPAFDVTLARFISAIITEKGIAYPPFLHSLADLMRK